MNICLLKESLNIGGTERSAANISKVLSTNHTVFFALYDGSDIKYSYNGLLIDFKLPPKPSLLGKFLNTILRDIKLRYFIKKERIDILYTFTGIGNRQTRYRYNDTVKIISARDFGGMRDCHDKYLQALRKSDAMICNSEYTKDFFLTKYPEYESKVFTLYNFIDIDEIKEQSNDLVEDSYNNFISNHDYTIVSVGRFCQEKGFEYLIESFACARHNNNIGLVLVGDGELKQKYLNSIEDLGLIKHVYITGFQKNPYKYMAKCTCFVLSSLSEGFPNVLAEAMSLNLPVIAVNCYSGPAEILRKDKKYDVVNEQIVECDYGIMSPRFTDGDNTNAIEQLGLAMNLLLGDSTKLEHYSRMSQIRAQDFSKHSAQVLLDAIIKKIYNDKRND